MALHEQCVGATDEWYTPPAIFEALDVRFSLDVASPGADIVPWVPAVHHVTRDSLGIEWAGFVWMNPPFGARNGLAPWLEKFFAHGDGIALVPDRTSAPWWQDYAPRADLALAVRSKIRFLRPDGSSGASPAQGTTLLAMGGGGVRRPSERGARRPWVAVAPGAGGSRMTRRPEPAHIVADSLARLSAADRSRFLRELLAHTAAWIVVIDGTEAAAMAIYRLGGAVVSRKVGA